MGTNIKQLFARGLETIKHPCNNLISMAISENENVISPMAGNTLISI